MRQRGCPALLRAPACSRRRHLLCGQSAGRHLRLNGAGSIRHHSARPHRKPHLPHRQICQARRQGVQPRRQRRGFPDSGVRHPCRASRHPRSLRHQPRLLPRKSAGLPLRLRQRQRRQRPPLPRRTSRQKRVLCQVRKGRQGFPAAGLRLRCSVILHRSMRRRHMRHLLRQAGKTRLRRRRKAGHLPHALPRHMPRGQPRTQPAANRQGCFRGRRRAVSPRPLPPSDTRLRA